MGALVCAAAGVVMMGLVGVNAGMRWPDFPIVQLEGCLLGCDSGDVLVAAHAGSDGRPAPSHLNMAVQLAEEDDSDGNGPRWRVVEPGLTVASTACLGKGPAQHVEAAHKESRSRAKEQTCAKTAPSPDRRHAHRLKVRHQPEMKDEASGA